jgi:serine/threonine-protein kinase OSR1/STK39
LTNRLLLTFAFQKEYIRGISGWNFNLEDLKNAAALIDNTNGTCHLDGVNSKFKDGLQEANEPENIYQGRANLVASARPEDETQEVEDLDGALASSFPSRPLEALKLVVNPCLLQHFPIMFEEPLILWNDVVYSLLFK